ncbi:hypothetical protein VNO78_21706 [Psophocarpus tetragonolobus]|uniref:PCI domain-containing protein n=1 Tax=Psophocarpus tetragonolobus TaxID=3891 RepID=A0AAN9SGX6_PSOTE
MLGEVDEAVVVVVVESQMIEDNCADNRIPFSNVISKILVKEHIVRLNKENGSLKRNLEATSITSANGPYTIKHCSIAVVESTVAKTIYDRAIDASLDHANGWMHVAKTIYDRAIDTSLDHANGWMVSNETGDIYSTNKPQLAFNSRIALSLNMPNKLADVAKKQRLNSVSPIVVVESIVAKAIYDRAIDASLDHANGWMLFEYCIFHHPCKEKGSVEKRRERQQQELE